MSKLLFTATKPKKVKVDSSRVIALDFDGVIHNPSGKFGVMGEPLPHSKAAIDALVDDGWRIIIFTLRAKNRQHVADWLEFHDIPYHDITDVKPDAAFYVDDKAIRHIDWATTIAEIKTREDVHYDNY